jgi:prepilin-type processing-associated H-X9-DG protein
MVGGNRGSWAYTLGKEYLYPGTLPSEGTVFACPMDSLARTGTAFPRDVRSYVGNKYLMPFEGDYVPILKSSGVSKPAQTVVVAEMFHPQSKLWSTTYCVLSGGTADGTNIPTWEPTDGLGIRYTHGKTQNFLFIDGHAKNMVPLEAKNDLRFIP